MSDQFMHGFLDLLRKTLAIDSIFSQLKSLQASINDLRQELSQIRKYLKDKLMTKDELIALIESKSQAESDLIVAESAQVSDALASLQAAIDDLKVQVETGNDLTSVVAALDAAYGKTNAAIEGIYTPDVTPAPAPGEPGVEPVEPAGEPEF